MYGEREKGERKSRTKIKVTNTHSTEMGFFKGIRGITRFVNTRAMCSPSFYYDLPIYFD